MVPKTAQTLAAIIMLTFILTGGYFVRGQLLPLTQLACLHAVYLPDCPLRLRDSKKTFLEVLELGWPPTS